MKSQGVNSGQRAGHSCAPRLPIQRPAILGHHLQNVQLLHIALSEAVGCSIVKLLVIHDLVAFPVIIYNSLCSTERKDQQLAMTWYHTILSPSGALVLFQHIRMGLQMPNNGSYACLQILQSVKLLPALNHLCTCIKYLPDLITSCYFGSFIHSHERGHFKTDTNGNWC